MKNNRNPLYSAVHYALAAGVASGVGASGVAFAQDEDVAELERVEVTGSRIKRTDIEGPNPVFVMQREDIEQTGLVTVGEILENLPIAGSGLNTNFNNGGNGAILLDLRNLGSNRLLVLVNGRRWITFPTSSAVDLQTIPTAIIERVEVLKDGASAIYGSDAISGVVNIITRDDFVGAQANAYYGEWDEDDGETTQADFSIGSTGERSSVFMNASYVKQEPIFAGDRDISKEPTFGTGNNFGSSGTPEGRVFFIDPDTGGIRDLTFQGGATFPDGAPLSAYRPFTSADRYNFAPDNYLLTPSERYNVYTSGRYELTDNIAFFGEAVFNKRESSQLLAAQPLFIGEFVGDSTYIPADNPFNPFGITFGTSGGGTLFFMGRRMLEAGNRIFNQDVHTFQFSGGFEGNFEIANRFWDWETYYQFAKTDIAERNVGELHMGRIQTAFDPALCNVDPNCPGLLNIFGGAGADTVEEVARTGGTIDPAVANYITFVSNERFIAERNLYAANVTGTIFDLPAGPLGVAVGYEYRREKGLDQPSDPQISGLTSGNARQATAGSFTVEEAYVEFSVPILADMPGFEVLEASLAARFSDYDTFGSTTNSKIGLRWQPYSDLLLRGTFGEAFRAPTINELFQGQSDSFPTVVDPCSDMLGLAGAGVVGGRDAPQPQNVIDNCIADGVPANGSYRQINNQIRITVGGNPNVGPEKADTITAGLVFSPGFLDGFDFTFDYYDIELTDTITTLGPNTILQGCYIGGNQNLCDLITRGAGGVVDDLLNASVNIGATETSGYDVGINYSFPETPVGFFELQWDATYVEEFVNFVPTGTGELDENSLVGFNAGDVAFPRWKSNLFIDWSYGDWSAVYDLRYIHHQDEVCPGPLVPFGVCSGPLNSAAADPSTQPDPEGPPINHLESVVYHDAQISYHYQPWDTRFTVGGRNIWDKEPPLCFQCFANSYDPTTYDVPGRFWYVRVTTNF